MECLSHTQRLASATRASKRTFPFWAEPSWPLPTVCFLFSKCGSQREHLPSDVKPCNDIHLSWSGTTGTAQHAHLNGLSHLGHWIRRAQNSWNPASGSVVASVRDHFRIFEGFYDSHYYHWFSIASAHRENLDARWEWPPIEHVVISWEEAEARVWRAWHNSNVHAGNHPYTTPRLQPEQTWRNVYLSGLAHYIKNPYNY